MKYTEDVYTPSDDFVYRNIGGELILVPVKNRTADINSLLTLNEVAGRFYELLDGSKTVADIAATLLGEYAVEEQELMKDLQELLELLIANGVIVKV